MFIVLEGMDCTGKSRLATDLKRKLNGAGYKVLHLAEPHGKGADNKAVRELIINGNYTQHAKACLALASRIDLFEKKIRPGLDDNKIVIVERNFISTMVYQGEDDPEGVLDLHVTAMESFSAQLDPDLLVHLEISYNEFEERLAKRKLPADKIEKMLGKEDNFNRLSKSYQKAIALALENVDTVLLKSNDFDTIYDAIIREVAPFPAYKKQ